jgi:hypothetical protein
MKNLRTTLIGVCITLSCLSATAQNNTVPINEPDYNKPKLFQHLPDVITVNVEDLNSLLNKQVGKSISINLADKSQSAFQLEGEVVSETLQPDNGSQTISIRSSNYPGASFTLSRITNLDGTVRYSGRIISFKHGDLLELQQRNGQWMLVKRNFYDLVNE